ncbi:hypothetical protein JDV09_03160, partial [Mycobacterium sp. Y57]|nr:hypothetical protein [Mycolicibacterium xanthum]
AYITRERRLNALQRELDRAAAEQAAEQRRAKAAAEREAKPPRPSPDLDDRFPIRPPGYQPDYGDDPPPF